jgi:hypothetical protein
MNFSLHLPPKLQSKNNFSSQKSKGEYVVVAFAKLDNYRTALATLKDAKQRERKEGVEIIEDQFGQKIKVTGPLHSGVKSWVGVTVTYGKHLNWGFYDEDI